MSVQDKLLKRAKQLGSKVPLLGTHARRAACQELASYKTVQAVPFLVSVLASNDDEVRRLAESALSSMSDPDAIDAIFLGYRFTEHECLRRILTTLGRTVPEVTELRKLQTSQFEQEPSPAEEAWRYRNARDGTILTFIPEGNFLACKEGTLVHLPPHYLALGCVTNAQYATFLNERRPNSAKLTGWINLRQSSAILKEGDAYVADPKKADLPAVWVTWEGATAYCKWAGLRLPTEPEWEKGARGVDGRLYPWGDEWEAGRPLPAHGERQPTEITSVWAYPSGRSPYGLYQMIGNVYEWCADWFEESAFERYGKGDLRPPSRGENRALRGGPWCFGTLAYLRTEYRKGTVWRGGTILCGFRCAKSL